MSIPSSCTVLVIGGGPGGSYAASALAREGVDVALLEADVFPRYHIGESMLPSIRHFLRFIDLESTFDNYGFEKKFGAAFKLNEKEDAYTDFIAAGGPNAYSWNLIRSESDELMFKHAKESGAKVYDGVQVTSINFVPWQSQDFANDPESVSPGRPVSAVWHRKSDKVSSTIRFEYLIDASGRNGIISTKYLKNRKFNKGLQNIAHWAYWKGAGRYAKGTFKENQPFFEALTDASGWCWAIPLHNGTMSVGIVMRQDMFIVKKKALGVIGQAIYSELLKLAPHVQQLLSEAEMVSDIKAASDWSYNASTYAGSFFRIVGDAGCFIDPYFSSGVHLALASALSAAVTIQASRLKQSSELVAAKWHSSKVTEGYTRFLLVVITALKQIRKQMEPVLSDFDEEGFDTAFNFFRPIIQGIADADVGGKLTQAEVSKTVDFCLNAFLQVTSEQREDLLRRLKQGGVSFEALSKDELQVLDNIRARKMLRSEDPLDLSHFTRDNFEGFKPNLKHGELGFTAMKDAYDSHENDLIGIFNEEAIKEYSKRQETL